MFSGPTANIHVASSTPLHGAAGATAFGAPRLRFTLNSGPDVGELTGRAEIFWDAPHAPFDRLEVPQARGRIYWHGVGRYTRIFGFEGQIAPPTTGRSLRGAPVWLIASFSVDNVGNGIGVFRFAGHSSGEVPVKTQMPAD